MKKSLKISNIPYINLLGVKIHIISQKRVIKAVWQWVNTSKVYQISTPNPEQIVQAQSNKAFLQALNQSDLNIPDGIGLVWAVNKVLKRQTQKGVSFLEQERITGIDLMLDLCQQAVQNNWRIFLLGGKPGIAKQAAAKLFQQGPTLLENVAYYEGAEDIKNETPEERKTVIKKINDFRPHLLFVAYGAPYQEQWLQKNRPHLKIKVGMSVGGALDYISGRIKRAPAWLRQLHLEWAYRLIRQPWRIKRQLDLLKFGLLILKKAI